MTKKLTYTDAMIEIEEILSKIEKQELNIDTISDDVKKVSKLILFCKTKLKNTEIEIEKIIEKIDA